DSAGRSTRDAPSWPVTTSTTASTASPSSDANARVAQARVNRTLRPAAGVPSGRLMVSVTWVMSALLGEDVLDDVGAAAVRHLDEIIDRPEPFTADDRASPQRVGRSQIRVGRQINQVLAGRVGLDRESGQHGLVVVGQERPGGADEGPADGDPLGGGAVREDDRLGDLSHVSASVVVSPSRVSASLDFFGRARLRVCFGSGAGSVSASSSSPPASASVSTSGSGSGGGGGVISSALPWATSRAAAASARWSSSTPAS